MNRILEEDALTIAQTPINWQKFHNKTILIAGANGYVPQHFVHGFMMRNKISNEDIHVIALCRNENKARERFGEYFDREDFTLLIGDVLEEIKIEKKIDFIIDAASPAGVKTSNEDPVATFETNVFGCSNLLKLAQHHHAEFLYLSSVDIYGRSHQERFAEDETGILDSLDVRNVYAAAKRAAENLCVCYGQRGSVCKIVRPGQIMGCGIALDDGRLHIDFISQMLKSDKIVLKGDGTPVRTFIYMTDAIAGMLYVMSEGENAQAYNICTEMGEASVLELAQTMAGQGKGKSIQVDFNRETRKNDPAVKHAVSRVCTSSDKLSSLGWSEQVSLEEACRRMMTYYGIPL